ncbi:MAG: helix-turn-helix domain-containing protein [Planctomycetota bacterium]
MKFNTEELDQLADAVSVKVLERLKPFFQSKAGSKGPTVLLTVDELSRLLGVPKSKIYNLVHLKKIPHVKVGQSLRFRRKDIDAWLQESYTPAVTNSFNSGGG